MEKIILHIDVNSAFLSWSAVKLLEEGYSKDIRNEVSVIAGNPKKRHGVIVAASIPAKKIGIKPPINLFEARKKCNNLIVVPPDYTFYSKKSKELMEFLKSLFSDVEQYSIDECFIDYTGFRKLYGNEIDFAYKLKNEICKRFKFTVNIGIGNNKLCAKMASDFEKPNKVHTLYLNEFKDKVWNMDISNLFMAGRASCKKLRELNINKIGELANSDLNMLIRNLKSQGKLLYEYANGIDNSEINNESYTDRKGIGFSRTLEYDMTDKEEIYKYLYYFSKEISKELREKNLYASTLVITIRNDEFKTYNHQRKYLNGINLSDDIYEKSKELFNYTWNKEPIRLIGLRVCDLTDSIHFQLSMFDEVTDNVEEEKLQNIIDKINSNYGKEIINKANKKM